MKAKRLMKYCVQGLAGGLSVLLINSCAVSEGYNTYRPAPAPSIDAPQDSGEVAETAANAAAPTTALRNTDRPGLATRQGRTISSKVNMVGFVRAHKTKPKGTATMYYNDDEGIDAMTARGYRYKGSGLQDAAGGLIEWGVRSGFRYAPNYQMGSKRFIVGKKGREYALVIKNKCHSRLEVVLSIDGLNILSGQPASYKQRGYVIQPGKTLVVKGYRTSQNAVNAFKFSDVRSSYTNVLHGTTKNVGVIGMAVFTEKGVSPWRWSPRVVEDRFKAKAF